MAGSLRAHVCLPEVSGHRLLRNPERAANTDCLKLTRVNEAVNGHLRNAHDRSHLGHGQESDIAQRSCVCCHWLPSSDRTATPNLIWRISHARIQRKSCMEKGNPVRALPFRQPVLTCGLAPGSIGVTAGHTAWLPGRAYLTANRRHWP